MPRYQVQWNSRSLDGLPGLHSSMRDKGESIWWARVTNWVSYYHFQLDVIKTAMALMFLVMVVAQWVGYVQY